MSLFDSIKRGDLNLAKSLIEEGSDINIKHENGETPLHMAISMKNLDIIALLIEKGADINVKGKGDFTPLHYAIDEGNMEIAKLLVKKGADVDSYNNSLCQTPFDMALDCLDLEQTKYIFRTNKNISLYFAISGGDLEAGEILIKKGAKIDQTDDKLNTFLHLASRKGNFKLVKFCIEKGADVNFKNSMRKTPLDYAKNEEIKEYLVLQGGTHGSLVAKTIGVMKWFIIRFTVIILGLAIVYGFLYLLDKAIFWF